jgi:EmrB/QacA subfamily drug resistance transporter
VSVERKWWTLVVVCLAIFMLLLDITIVNVALPKIGHDLKASFSDLQWVVDAYALTLAALLLTAGSLSDLLGRKRIFMGGLFLFTLASAICGLAPTALVLILARGAQGIGGAVLFATSLSLLAQEFHGRERGTAFAIWGATTGAAVAIGPLVGGALTDSLGWPAIFYLNLPLGAIAIAITVAQVRETRNPEAERVDYLGLVTFSTALFLLVFALIRGNAEGWGSGLIVGFLIGAAALLLAFVAIERRLGRHAMFDLGLFRVPTFAGAAIVAFALSASMFAMFLYLTLYIQSILGFSPLEAGVRFLPITLLSFVVAAASGNLSARVPVRALLSVGLVLVGSGLLLMRGLGPGSTWTALLAGFICAGAEIGMINPPLASSAIGVVPPQRSGMGSGINNTFRQVGIATGIAALGAIFQSRITNSLGDLLAGTPGAAHVHQLGVAVAGGGAKQALAAVPAAGRPTVEHAIKVAFTSGLNDILLLGAIIAFAGAVLGLLLVRGRDFLVHPGAEPAAAAA